MSMWYFDTRSIKSQSSNGDIHAYSAKDKRITGITRDSTFVKSDWRSTKDLCHKHKAIGLNKAAFLRYILPFFTFIAVPDKDTRTEYRSTVEDFRQFAIEDDRGKRVKLCLPLIYWSIIEPGGTKYAQLRLFSIKQPELLDTISKDKRA
jgi:hypothetical protein